MVSRLFCSNESTNFCKTEFVHLFLCTVNVLTTFNFVEKIRRFVVTKLVKLSDEFVMGVDKIKPLKCTV